MGKIVPTKRPDRLSALIQRFRVRARANVIVSGACVRCRHRRRPRPQPNLFVVGFGQLHFSGSGMRDFSWRGTHAHLFPARHAQRFSCRHPILSGLNTSRRSSIRAERPTPLPWLCPTTWHCRLMRPIPSNPWRTLLLEEALTPRCGGQAVIDPLVRDRRHPPLAPLDRGRRHRGRSGSGLAHPNLSLAIVAMHDQPGRNWRVEDLAEIAAMSRTHFINSFREIVGVPPRRVSVELAPDACANRYCRGSAAEERRPESWVFQFCRPVARVQTTLRGLAKARAARRRLI